MTMPNLEYPYPPLLPVPPGYFYKPIIIQHDAGVPLDVVLGGAISQAVNGLSAQGWEVLLPAIMIPAGSAIIGGAKTMLWVFWVRRRERRRWDRQCRERQMGAGGIRS